MLKRFVKSCCVWYIYVPHINFLRLIGPYPALVLSRFSAFVHEICTYFGSQRSTRRVIDRAFSSFQTIVGPRTVLRRYLRSKHQRFVEWYVYPTVRGRKFVAQTYQDAKGTEHLDNALSHGKGAIVLVFHYGMAKMVWPALKALGYDNHQHVFRGATYAGNTYDSVARLAMTVLADTERDSGLNLVYHRPNFTLEQLYRLLKRNQIIGMNGDGMMGNEFISVPFLNGKMQVPTGPARLAARTGAPIIPVYAVPERFGKHRMIIHAPIYCKDDNPACVNECVSEYVAILDGYVKRYPWEWWTWRRLNVGETQDRELLYGPQALGTDDGSYHIPQTASR